MNAYTYEIERVPPAEQLAAVFFWGGFFILSLALASHAAQELRARGVPVAPPSPTLTLPPGRY